MQSRKSLRTILPLLAAGLFHGAPAGAATYCADTTQELVLALATAAQSAEDDEVRVRALTFNLTSNVVLSFRGSLTVSGGWTLNCLLQSQNPGATVITNTTPGAHSFVLRPNDGDLTVERLTFDRLDGVVLQDVGNAASVVGRITLARNRFILNDFGPIVRVRDKSARIENNIITGSLQRSLQFDRSTATAPIAAEIHNNTIVGGTEGMRVSGSVGTVRVRNNVIDGDYAASALYLVDGVVAVNHNSLDGGFGYIGGASASPMFDNDLGIDPMFDANFVPQAGSPLINSGTNAIVGGLPSVDFAGATRRIGSRVDRGARESTVSDLSTLFVTSTADSGPGTLRQAILDANVTGIQESIEFDIDGTCPRTITLATTLPAISDALTIDAFTQPGASPNSNADGALDGDNAVRCIVLSGTGTGIFNLTPGPNREVVLRGFALVGATGAQVRINGVGRATLNGNAFNTGTSVVSALVPQYAINIDGTPGTIVGGADNDQRNLIGGASIAGVRLGPGADREVEGNFIGVADDAAGDVGNGIGIQVIDGQSDTIRDNVIGFSDTDGVRIEGASAVIGITGNQIGRSPRGSSGGLDVPNARNGVRLQGGTVISINGNRIARNGAEGILGLSAVRRADIGSNQIGSNGGLGVDFSPAGVNPIDNDTGAGGVNAGQNFPELIMATGGRDAGRLVGRLRSANGTYLIVAYLSSACDPSGYGEGATTIGWATITIANGTNLLDGEAQFSFDIAGPDGFAVAHVTATATEVGGPDDNSASEFSQCIPYEVTDLFANGFE